MSLLVNSLNYIAKTKPAKYLTGPYAPAAIATVTTLSCLTKDALNCVYYVTQSLNNKRIPDDKRNFVAGLDLANGILNIVTQSAAAFWFSKNVNKFFSKVIEPKYFPADLAKNYVTKYGMEPRSAKAVADSLKAAGKGGLTAFATLFITQVICKRVVVPLIATPMATYFKKKFDKKHPNPNVVGQDVVSFEKNKPQPENIVNSAVPADRAEKLPQCFKSFVK